MDRLHLRCFKQYFCVWVVMYQLQETFVGLQDMDKTGLLEVYKSISWFSEHQN